ncbi:putative beta-1,4-xylosyltransferase IRX14H [Hibiscus syriacus]|uniref:Glycosyltransferases n=1 Tax=Hibiscus syriacus TaxID=106335 RepID=A0A6A2ZPR1_HIBSY|nr:probable beta-1,4-xylosyltransferase IRX14H [Hibiscus syriacus]KAE8693329.1 putative beta-1,4-xylosyltransferase IRX14H [Hibiscus syriacus]
MKLSVLQQSYLNRRSNSFRSSGPLDSSSDSAIKSPAAIFWLVLHGLSCLISLVLGFRFSRLVFLLFSTSYTNLYTSPFHSSSELAKTLDFHSLLPTNPVGNVPLPSLNNTVTNSRVVVGRHGIRIRPWPHPNPVEVMKAHQIIERVQTEQRLQFGVKDPRKIIVVTPTYVRTFQALHLTGVMHSLMLVPYDLVWIVVEAGGISNETASLIAKSGLKTIHVGFNQRMPNSWDQRHKLESKMRLRALRIIREKKLDGIIMFADDSNMHSMELFDEIQNVKWFGAVSVGILANSASTDETVDQKKGEEENPPMPVQGPACNVSNMLAGWHTFNTLPFAGRSAVYIDDRATVLPRMLEWSGFVLNSRLLWKDGDKPDWIKDIDALDGDIENPLGLVKVPSVVEPLGSCGRRVLLWWLRVEARADSKFPPRWIIDPPLEITVPSKRTPWPDTPPELPANEKPVIGIQEPTLMHTTKTRTSRSKRRSKRKHDEARADRRTGF